MAAGTTEQPERSLVIRFRHLDALQDSDPISLDTSDIELSPDCAESVYSL